MTKPEGTPTPTPSTGFCAPYYDPERGTVFRCACRFHKKDEFSPAEVVDVCGYHAEKERALAQTGRELEQQTRFKYAANERADKAERALAAVKDNEGLASIVVGKCVYDPRAMSFRFTIECVAEGGVDRDGARYRETAHLLGLPPLGTTFTNRGDIHKIVGLNSTGSKVITQKSDGRKYLWKPDVVKGFVLVQSPKPKGQPALPLS